MDFLGVIDKWDRAPEKETEVKLAALGVPIAEVRAFIANPSLEVNKLSGIMENMRARGLAEFVEVDLTIVRGIAYYTGLVFEVFDRNRRERALAGGGRYDRLLEVVSDGKVSMPALGFGMGDVVLANLIEDMPAARAKRDAWLAEKSALDVYVVVAAEEKRADALGTVQRLREAGWKVEYAWNPAKVGKQFQAAESAGARFAVVMGQEWPTVKLKKLASREGREVDVRDLLSALVEWK